MLLATLDNSKCLQSANFMFRGEMLIDRHSCVNVHRSNKLLGLFDIYANISMSIYRSNKLKSLNTLLE